MAVLSRHCACCDLHCGGLCFSLFTPESGVLVCHLLSVLREPECTVMMSPDPGGSSEIPAQSFVGRATPMGVVGSSFHQRETA